MIRKNVLNKFFILVMFAIAPLASWAADAEKIKFNFRDAEIIKVLEDYSQATGQKFLIDPIVKGKITLINPDRISPQEAFNQLSSALAVNGIGISTQEDVMHVMQARNLQRNFIPVVKELPPLRPERMYTYIISLKYVSADEVNKQLRILTSKDGEMVPNERGNEIIVSDWSSNLHRVAAIIQAVDQPAVKKVKPETKAK